MRTVPRSPWDGLRLFCSAWSVLKNECKADGNTKGELAVSVNVRWTRSTAFSRTAGLTGTVRNVRGMRTFFPAFHLLATTTFPGFAGVHRPALAVAGALW